MQTTTDKQTKKTHETKPNKFGFQRPPPKKKTQSSPFRISWKTFVLHRCGRISITSIFPHFLAHSIFPLSKVSLHIPVTNCSIIPHRQVFRTCVTTLHHCPIKCTKQQPYLRRGLAKTNAHLVRSTPSSSLCPLYLLPTHPVYVDLPPISLFLFVSLTQAPSSFLLSLFLP